MKPSLHRALFLAALGASAMALLTACGSSSAGVDAALDVPGLDAAALDAAPDGAAAADAIAACDAGIGPADLPPVHGTFVIVGGDGGATEPTPSGGDPVGTWRVGEVSMYLPAAAQGQVDTAASALTGTGWIAIDAARYRLALNLLVRLETTAVGTVTRAVESAAVGGYAVRGAELALSPECATGTGTATPSLGFSRDAPDRGRLFITLTGAMGRTLLVLSLDRAN